MVLVLDRVRTLVERLTPQPICDRCISELLSLAARERTDHLARELAGRAGFERYKDKCSMCGSVKVVTYKKLH